MFISTLQPELCQGDVLEGIEITEPFSTPATTTYQLLLLTNDCDIDKVKEYSALLTVRVTPMSVVEAVNRGKAGEIRRGRVPCAMLVAGHERVADHFLDFRFIHRVPRDEVLRANAEGRRVASMTEDARLAVVGWMHKYFVRKQPALKPGERAPVMTPTPPPVAEDTGDETDID